MSPDRRQRRKWISRQRRDYWHGDLNPSQIKRLELVGISWGRREVSDALSVEDHVKKAEMLAATNGGLLPARCKLQRMGLKGLASAINRYRDKFAHIKREVLKTYVDEWVDLAERLALDNGGTLPCPDVLCDMGHDGLLWHMRENRDKFSHIKIGNTRDWHTYQKAKDVFRLADGDGKLPLKKELVSKGLSWVVSFVGNRPDLFPCLEFTVPKFDREAYLLRHLGKATEVAKANNGLLPSNNRLSKMGLNTLVLAIRRFPERFSHFQRIKYQPVRNDSWMSVVPDGKVRRKKEEWIALAEKIAEVNGGFLPSKKALERNRLHGLVSQIKKNPDCFKHIRRNAA